MNQSGKIAINNLKTLITGRWSTLGTSLTRNLIKSGASQIYSVDNKMPQQTVKPESIENFTCVNLANESFFSNYLKHIGPIDSMVNCAGVRRSYNYYLTYLQSKNIFEKMRENKINEYGCRGCIINLVHMSAQYDDQYFREQDEFAEKYGIDTEKIDDEVFALADQLTGARIRCNTILVTKDCDLNVFSSLVKHILEDQYVAGQTINMEDNLRHMPKEWDEIAKDYHKYPPKKMKVAEEKYQPPKDHIVKPLISVPNDS